VPQIGFCGGFQLIARLFGSTLGHIGTLREDDPDHSGTYHAGLFKEWGVYPVRVLRPDPLFAGLGGTIRVLEAHMDEVKDLAPDLVLLASSERCRVQAFRHRTKPIYGTQFHPEMSPEAFPDGRKVLENFFRIARAPRDSMTRATSRPFFKPVFRVANDVPLPAV
jgi:GMP synthase (glutamine-hydrolysing)